MKKSASIMTLGIGHILFGILGMLFHAKQLGCFFAPTGSDFMSEE